MQYLHTIGARPAPAKCFTLSTSPNIRFRLGAHYWMELQSKVKVALEARDLGGHLSTTARIGGATLAQRMRKARVFAHRLACFPWGWKAKRQVVETLIYPMALYGCEASPINDSDMAKLATAVAKAIGPYSQNSSTILAGLLLTPGRNLSGDFAVLNRSFSLLRRIVAKHPQARATIQIIFDMYLQKGKAWDPGYQQPPSSQDPKPTAWTWKQSELEQ